MRVETFIPLATAAAITATATGTAVDLSQFTGNGYAVLNSSATGGAGMTSNVKLQDSDDNVTFADTAFAFDQVANAAASFQAKFIAFDQFRKYVRAVNTLGGTSPTVTYGVHLVGTKASQ